MMFRPWASRGARARALLVGLLVVAGAPTPAGAQTAPGAAAGGCVHDATLEAAVARALRKKIRELEPSAGARVQITFGCPALVEIQRATALAAHGHGGFVSLVDVDRAGEAGSQTVALRLRPSPADLGGPAPAILRATVRPRDEVVARAFAFASAALVAAIQIQPAAAGRDGVHTTSTVTTTHDEALAIRLVGLDGRTSTSRWEGYVDSAHASARVPLEVAWETLWAIGDRPLRPAAPEAADRAAFARLTEAGAPGPRLETDALLELGAALATQPVAPWLAGYLGAPSDRTRTRAVNALATATGTDLRRDSSGAVRPLADVIAAYRALAGSPAPRHD